MRKQIILLIDTILSINCYASKWQSLKNLLTFKRQTSKKVASVLITDVSQKSTQLQQISVPKKFDDVKQIERKLQYKTSLFYSLVL